MTGTVCCTNCLGRFAKGFFVDPDAVKVCRMCQRCGKLEEELREANNKILSLTQRVEAMEASGSTRQAHETNDTTSNRPNISCESARDSSPTDSTNRNLPASPTEFVTVRNGIKAAKKIISPLTISNSFQILAEAEDEMHDVNIVGDSIIRGQLVEFCGRAPRNRKRFCIPGAKIDDVREALDEISISKTNNLLVVHTGTNEVVRARSEELLERYKKMIHRCKEKTSNVLISGILPRIDAIDAFYRKAFSINNRLKSLCLQEGVDYVNNWDNFYQQPWLFARDGLHLNGIGSARFGRLLNDAVRSFWQKNTLRPGEIEAR